MYEGCDGIALCVLSKEVDITGNYIWKMKSLLEPIQYLTQDQKEIQCSQIVLQNVPAFQRILSRTMSTGQQDACVLNGVHGVSRNILTGNTSPVVLVIANSSFYSSAVAKIMENSGINVYIATDVSDAVAMMQCNLYTLFILDTREEEKGHSSTNGILAVLYLRDWEASSSCTDSLHQYILTVFPVPHDDNPIHVGDTDGDASGSAFNRGEAAVADVSDFNIIGDHDVESQIVSVVNRLHVKEVYHV